MLISWLSWNQLHVHHTKNPRARPQVIIPNFICHYCRNAQISPRERLARWRAQAAGPEERHRVTYAYSVHGEKVCQAVLLYANSCTRHVLQKVQAHLEAGCVVTPTHGLSGKKPWNVHSDEENLIATLFIQNYGCVEVASSKLIWKRMSQFGRVEMSSSHSNAF